MINYLAVYECKEFRQPSGTLVCYIEDTPENVAAFVASASVNKNYAFINSADTVKLFSKGNFLDLVMDKEYLNHELLPVLVPMQTGEREIPEVKVLSEQQIFGRVQKM